MIVIVIVIVIAHGCAWEGRDSSDTATCWER